jgi:hypothetical protein
MTDANVLPVPIAGDANPDPDPEYRKGWIDPDKANSYATTKTFAQGFFDAALIAANSTQIVFIVKNNLTEDKLGYVLFVMAILSICINFVIFVFLVLIAMLPMRQETKNTGDVKSLTRKLNYVPTVLIGVSLIVNIIGAAFASGVDMPTPPSTTPDMQQ